MGVGRGARCPRDFIPKNNKMFKERRDLCVSMAGPSVPPLLRGGGTAAGRGLPPHSELLREREGTRHPAFEALSKPQPPGIGTVCRPGLAIAADFRLE